MGRDHPDGTSLTLKAEVVSTTVVSEIAANETPVWETEGKVTNLDQSYQRLAKWTVTADKNGVLYGIELYSSNFAKSHFKLEIDATALWEDVEFPTGVNGHFGDARLPAATVVEVFGKSNDGTSVDLWGMIEGKEVG